MTDSSSHADVCHFSRSFIRWRIDTTKRMPTTVSRPPPTTLNDVRMPLDCLATVSRNGREEVFGLGVSCKTEQVFVERDVWHQPNADMLAICGAGQFFILKRFDRTEKGVMLSPPSLGRQPERAAVDPVAAFESHSLDIRRRPSRRLGSIEDIIGELRGSREIVARTTHSIPGGEVMIEYPVRTVNYSDRHRYFQVDTGPVLFFGPATGPQTVEHFHLAYIAHLGGDWAEFLVCQPTPLEDTGVSVHHFSESRRVSARHSLWVVEE